VFGQPPILDSVDFRSGDGPGRAVVRSEVAPREGTVEHRGVSRATATVDLVDRPDENPRPRIRDHDPLYIGVETLDSGRGAVVLAFGDMAAHSIRCLLIASTVEDRGRVLGGHSSRPAWSHRDHKSNRADARLRAADQFRATRAR